MRRIAVFVLALLSLSACEGDFTYNVSTGTETDSTAVQSEVQSNLESLGVEVASISCAELTSASGSEVGDVLATYLCTVEQPVGQAFEVNAETTMDAEPDGTPSVAWSAETRDVVIVSSMEQNLSARFSEDAGQPVAVSCDTPRVIPSTPGERFTCALSGTEREQQVLVTITSETGGIDYKVVG